MKPLVLITAGTLAFASPVFSADDNAASAEVAQESVAVSTVQVKGGGWGANKRVRAALSKQDGVKKLVLSGLRATIIMEDGKKLDEAKLKDALKAQKLEFVSLKEEKLAVPKATYVLAAEGTTWAVSNEKARLALEKLDNIDTAFVDNGITLCLKSDDAPDMDALNKEIKGFKMKITEVKKADSAPF